MSIDQCKSYYNDLIEDVICTNFTNDSNLVKNPCPGDAGAPLIYTSKTLVGILNLINGYKCDWPYPAVYTKIDCNKKKWIYGKMNKTVDDCKDKNAI